MINQNFTHFPFWRPVIIESNASKTDKKNALTNFFWSVGSLADQYASLSLSRLKMQTKSLHLNSIHYKVKEVQKNSLKFIAFKVVTFILSAGILPVIALPIKMIYKFYLNSSIASNKIIAEKLIGKTKIVLLSGDLMKENADAIVNPANRYLSAGGGVCGVFAQYAGEDPFKECQSILEEKNIKQIGCGEAVLTGAGKLAPKIKTIVHAVGPNCQDKKDPENTNREDFLKQAYQNSLELITNPKKDLSLISAQIKESKLLDRKPLRSIAFPSISTGIFDYPLNEAATVTVKTIKDFITSNPDALDVVCIVCLPLDKDKQETLKFYIEAFKMLDGN